MQLRFPCLLTAVSLCLVVSCALTAQRTIISYNPLAAEYSYGLNKAVVVSASPDQLHLIDPVTGADSTVNLPKSPFSLAVSPDGLHAAVGHDALISYVNLSTLAVERTYPIPLRASKLALTPDAIIVFTGSSAQPLVVVQISTGNVIQQPSSTSQIVYGKYSSSQRALYGVAYGASVYSKFDASTTLLTPIALPNAQSAFCGNFWLSSDESRIYTSCAGVLRASATAAADLQSLGTLSPATQVVSVADSIASQRIAVIPGQVSSSFSYLSSDSSQVLLFDRNSFAFLGSLKIAPFVSGTQTTPVSGEFVFLNSSGTVAVVLSQTVSNAGFGVLDRIQLATSASCDPLLASSTATAIAQGTLGQATVSGSTDCAYQVTSNASWLQLLSGGYGSGAGTLTYIVRPNTTNAARTGVITLAGQTLTVTQDAAPASPPVAQPLSFNVVASDYSRALDKLILVSAVPSELHIYDPTSRADQIIPLPRIPVSVSVGPDGIQAAVGNRESVTLVNLQTGAVEQTLPISEEADSIVLSNNGYVYVATNTNTSSVASLEIATGILTYASGQLTGGPVLRLHPSQQFLYNTSSGQRWDITAGIAAAVQNTKQISTCGNGWLSDDGSRMITDCGQAYLTSVDPSKDLVYAGSLPIARLNWAADSSVRQTTAVIANQPLSFISDSNVLLFGDQFLDAAGTLALPQITANNQPYSLHGAADYFSSSANQIVVLATADPGAGLLSNYFVYTAAVQTTPGPCSISLGATNANVIAAGGFGDIAVTSAANCAWDATSNAQWLTITAGGFGAGTGKASFAAALNTTGIARTATISIAGLTYTVSQAAGPALAQLQAPAPGSALPVGTVNFTWSAGGMGTDAYWLDVGNSVGQGDISRGQLTDTFKAVSGIPCDGRTIYVRLWTHISGNWQTPFDYSFTACSASSTAQLLTPTPGTTFTSTSETFTWSPGGTGTDAYWLDVGNSVGHGDISAGQLTTTGKTVSGLPCDGRILYVRLWTHMSGAWRTPTDYTFTGCTGPAVAGLTSPTPGTTLTSTQTFTWSDGGTGTDAYWLDIGNSVGHGDINAGQLTATTKTVSGLPCDGRTIYVRLWTHISGVWRSPIDYTFSSCTGVPVLAALTSPTPGSTLGSSSQTFTWTAGSSGTDAYWLDVGNSVGRGDINAGQLTSTSKTVTGLPCDGRVLYLRLWTHISGAWQTPKDYTVNACHP